MRSIMSLPFMFLLFAGCGSDTNSTPQCAAGACTVGMSCTSSADCQSGVCTANACAAPTCTDGVKNGTESDKDCGGSCSQCTASKACGAASDCQSGVCTAKVCVASSCTDGLKNGTESDKDCGGSCSPCATGMICSAAADCQSGNCTAKACVAPSCTDSIKNGTETDKDCGGSCSPCATGLACKANGDCASNLCNANACYLPISCADIHTVQPNLPDGTYTISAGNPAAPFQAVCDMTRDGGGWTLILKANGDTTLQYDAVLWTDGNLLNGTDLTMNSGNAKYQGFLSLKVSQMRGELVGEGLFSQMFDGTLTATQIFNGARVSQVGLPNFQNGTRWSVQANCQSFGVNMFYTPGTNNNASRSRIGWSANNEADCNTNDTAIGLGVQYGYVAEGHGAGFIVTAGGNKGDVHAGVDGRLWVK